MSECFINSGGEKYFDDLGKKYNKSLERQTIKNLLKKYIDENKDNKIETKIEENLKTEENYVSSLTFSPRSKIAIQCL